MLVMLCHWVLLQSALRPAWNDHSELLSDARKRIMPKKKRQSQDLWQNTPKRPELSHPLGIMYTGALRNLRNTGSSAHPHQMDPDELVPGPRLERLMFVTRILIYVLMTAFNALAIGAFLRHPQEPLCAALVTDRRLRDQVHPLIIRVLLPAQETGSLPARSTHDLITSPDGYPRTNIARTRNKDIVHQGLGTSSPFAYFLPSTLVIDFSPTCHIRVVGSLSRHAPCPPPFNTLSSPMQPFPEIVKTLRQRQGEYNDLHGDKATTTMSTTGPQQLK
ncbi:hypothetical protein EDB85DRAFT_1900747 [Lactarius pseudohatsudake]|nr:hypothetical protein EDB85DRAFT_1900747 [Lactarius pseudohatsudake]